MDDTTTQVVHAAHAAIWAAWLIVGTLCLAVLGAMYSALTDQALGWLSNPLISGLYGLLRLFMLVTLLMLAYRLLVTYAHMYRGHAVTRHARLPEATRRRVAGSGRLWQGPGRHRAA